MGRWLKERTVLVVPMASCLILIGLLAWAQFPGGNRVYDETIQIETTELGPLGKGSKGFRTGLVHSSGVIFIGTYGPAPALIWKYDPWTQSLCKVAAPGEYQLDSMVETADGKVCIGTAYEGLVYELDPFTGSIDNLGTPPIDSTAWIFTMIKTRTGLIYGARGVGIFKLDRAANATGRDAVRGIGGPGLFQPTRPANGMENCGLVPGNHTTPGPGASNPVIRSLEQRPDGLVWGDTNRWIFTFDPKTHEIRPIVDLAAREEACYGIIHGQGESPVQDLYFYIRSRFSGKKPRHAFGICRAATGKIDPLVIEGFHDACYPCGWWQEAGKIYWLVGDYRPQARQMTLALVDIETQTITQRWLVPGNDTGLTRLAGPGLWFISSAPGTLYRADPVHKRLVPMAINPEPAVCRCLAASADGYLGAYTYDCGFAFTLNLHDGEAANHGRIDLEDHRQPFGPAIFAGVGHRFLVANHGSVVPRLWVSDLESNEHRPIGATAVRLLATRDGNVWGTQGTLSTSELEFAPGRSWSAGDPAIEGQLFHYRLGDSTVEPVPDLPQVGSIAEVPGDSGNLLLAIRNKLVVYHPGRKAVVSEMELTAPVAALVADVDASFVYVLLADRSLWSCQVAMAGDLTTRRVAVDFGPSDRGCFLLPRSRRLIGIAPDGTVSVFSPEEAKVNRFMGPPPLPAGPAVDPAEDAWYFADRYVVRYALASRDMDVEVQPTRKGWKTHGPGSQ